MAKPPSDLAFTDLAATSMFTDPFPRYAELRRSAPVSRMRHRESRVVEGYMLTRHEDVKTLHVDPRFSNDPGDQPVIGRVVPFLPKTMRLLTDSMVFKNDPEHLRLRRLVSKTFTPKMIKKWSVDIETRVATLIDQLDGAGEVDFVSDFATPLPMAVIADMLGIGTEDRDEFQVLAERFIEATAIQGPRGLIKMLPAARAMIKMFSRLADDRRRHPDEHLITALVQVNDDGEALTEQEIVSMIFLLLLAGHDTTSNLLGSSVLALIEHPEQLERLRAEPDLIDTAVEELLRYTTPVPCGALRTTMEDIEIAGMTIPRRSLVLGMIISANRDERVIESPDELDLGRQPNPHMSFAFGPHFCLGAQLARLEARTALSALVQRFERIELAVPAERLQYKPTVSLRGVQSLPLRLS
jgi:cytochrome P450